MDNFKGISESFDFLQKQHDKYAGEPRSERDEMIQKFADRLNFHRAQDGFKPLEVRRVAVKLSHVKTEDLHHLYKTCESARSFGGMFWYFANRSCKSPAPKK